MNESLNFLGVVRNGGAELLPTLQRIEALRKLLRNSQVILATNDNTDGTDEVLADYAAQAHEVLILRLDGMMADLSHRVERIAAARNAALQALFDRKRIYEQTLILDMDGPNAELESKSVLTAIRCPLSWDGLFANQPGAYYDIYALRCPGWCEYDVWQQIEKARKFRLFRKSRRKALISRLVYDRQYHIPTDIPPIPVQSAFGGLGLYRTAALRGVEYSAYDHAGELTCEHVMLHQAMGRHGAMFFIHPALLNLTQPEHLGPSSGAPLPAALRSDIPA